jgi:hypothetical protein
MGFIGSAISSILGGSTTSVTPASTDAEVATTTDEEEKLKKLRSALTATSGGMSGQEVLSTSKKSGLFGN